MSMLFAAGGGLIEAQDEAVAAALGKAAEEPAGLQSLGLMGSLGSTTALLDAVDGTNTLGGYGRVGPEDVSTSPLERMTEAARALEPEQFASIAARMTEVSTVLEDAATALQSGLDNVLGHTWQGEFADQARFSAHRLTDSAVELADQLHKVTQKAEVAQLGFTTTRQRIASEAADVTLAESRTPGFGRLAGPVAPSVRAEVEAARRAAEEQARAIVNTEYSPAVMDANLDDLDFTSAYRVVSTTALGGPEGINLARIWNTDGVPHPAQPAAPSASAIAAATGTGIGTDGSGPGSAGAGVGAGVGTTTSSTQGAAHDAATEQALLAARSGATDGGAAGAASAGQPGAGQAGAGGGVNAATTAAGAPMAPMAGANGQQAGAGAGGAGGIRGVRGGASGDDRTRDRGFGSTSGLLGGGGAAAAGAGAGASRMGGAGTLAGYGAGGAAGPGTGGPAAGAPGAGSAPGAAAGSGAGALSSSSSTGTAQAGRAGAMPMGGMMGAAGAGQNNERRGHTPAGYLTNATNTTAIIGEPVKVAPAVLGRKPVEEPAPTADPAEPFRARTLGRDYTGGGARER